MSDQDRTPYKTITAACLVFLLALVAATAQCDYQSELTERACLEQGHDPLHCKMRRR